MEFFRPQFSTMRVAITLEKFDLLRGGAEVAALRLVKELAARGHELHIVTTAVDVELPVGAQTHLIKVPWEFVAWRQISFARRVAACLRSLNCDLSIASSGRGFSEDVLWAQGGTQRAAAEGKERSFYYNPFLRLGCRYQHLLNIRTCVYRRLESRYFARRPPPFVIAPSKMIAAGFQRDYGLNAGCIRVVPYQIDLQRFSPERVAPLRNQSRESLKLQSDELAVVCAAQNFRRKGVRPLVEAAAILQKQGKTFSVIIAGLTARHAAPYEALARRLGCADRVRFIGHHDRIEELYAATDVFCLPTFFDPCAIASVEAMACGLASITSRYNGAAELMQHGVNGFVLEHPERPQELAQMLLPLFNADLRARVGVAAAEAARRISFQNPANEIARVVEEIADCRRRDQTLRM